MFQDLLHWRLFRAIAIAVLIAFVSMIPAQSGYAQVMPRPGEMVLASSAFQPTLMVGLRVDLKDPFNLYFAMSNGEKPLADDEREEEYRKLIKYFMASLITPNTDMWVNLSPKEADRIIPDNFSLTEMGRDLLAQDYLLKQFTASLISPDTRLGKQFWDEVYKKAYEMYGTTDIPVDTFNKVWITADKADIYQKNDTALLVGSHLKVMLEQDLMAIETNKAQFAGVVHTDIESAASRQLASDIVRRVIVPVIEKEVNEGANFAQVRQAYNSMILATWFKKTLKDSLLGQVYADQNKVAGIALNDPGAKDRIYQQYLQAYRTGVFNYIKEEIDQATRQTLPRKYFSGGMVPVDASMINMQATADQVDRVMIRNSRVAAVTLLTSEGGPFINKGDAAQADLSVLNGKLERTKRSVADAAEQYADASRKVEQMEKEAGRDAAQFSARVRRLVSMLLLMANLTFAGSGLFPKAPFEKATPRTAPVEMVKPAETVGQQEREYVVKPGDTLSKIAQKEYGSSDQWQKIHDANRDVVRDPNVIMPGMVLKIPGVSGAAEQADAGDEEAMGPMFETSPAAVPLPVNIPVEVDTSLAVSDTLSGVAAFPVEGDTLAVRSQMAANERFQDIQRLVNTEALSVIASFDSTTIHTPMKVFKTLSGNGPDSFFDFQYGAAKPSFEIRLVPSSDNGPVDFSTVKTWEILPASMVEQAEKDKKSFVVVVSWTENGNEHKEGILWSGAKAAEASDQMMLSAFIDRGYTERILNVLDIRDVQAQRVAIGEQFGMDPQTFTNETFFVAAKVVRDPLGNISSVSGFIEASDVDVQLNGDNVDIVILDNDAPQVLKYWPLKPEQMVKAYSTLTPDEVSRRQDPETRGASENAYLERDGDLRTRGDVVFGPNHVFKTRAGLEVQQFVLERQRQSLEQYQVYIRHKLTFNRIMTPLNLAAGFFTEVAPFVAPVSAGANVLFDLIENPNRITKGAPTEAELADFFGQYNYLKESGLVDTTGVVTVQQQDSTWNGLNEEEKAGWRSRALSEIKAAYNEDDMEKMFYYLEHRKDVNTAMYILGMVSSFLPVIDAFMPDKEVGQFVDDGGIVGEGEVHGDEQIPTYINPYLLWKEKKYAVLSDILNQKYVSFTGEVNLPQVISLAVNGKGFNYVSLAGILNGSGTILERFFSVAGVTVDLKSVVNSLTAGNDPLKKVFEGSVATPRFNLYLFGYPIGLEFEKALVDNIDRILNDPTAVAYEVQDGLFRSKAIAYTQQEFNTLYQAPGVARVPVGKVRVTGSSTEVPVYMIIDPQADGTPKYRIFMLTPNGLMRYRQEAAIDMQNYERYAASLTQGGYVQHIGSQGGTYNQNLWTHLFESFDQQGQIYFASGYTWDQMLVANRALLSGDTQIVRDLLSVYRTQFETATRRGDFNGFTTSFNVYTGSNTGMASTAATAMVGNMIMAYEAQTGDRVFHDMLEPIAEWLVDMQDNDGGVRLHPMSRADAQTIEAETDQARRARLENPKFVEPNAIVYSFLRNYSQDRQNRHADKYARKAGKVLVWIRARYDAQAGLFHYGQNRESYSADAQTRTMLAFGPEEFTRTFLDNNPANLAAYIDRVVGRFQVTVTDEHTGLTVTLLDLADSDIASRRLTQAEGRNVRMGFPEVTAEFVQALVQARAYLQSHDIDVTAIDGYIRVYTGSLNSMYESLGGLPQATASNEDTGFGWRTPVGRFALASRAQHDLTNAGENVLTAGREGRELEKIERPAQPIEESALIAPVVSSDYEGMRQFIAALIEHRTYEGNTLVWADPMSGQEVIYVDAQGRKVHVVLTPSTATIKARRDLMSENSAVARQISQALSGEGAYANGGVIFTDPDGSRIGEVGNSDTLKRLMEAVNALGVQERVWIMNKNFSNFRISFDINGDGQAEDVIANAVFPLDAPVRFSWTNPVSGLVEEQVFQDGRLVTNTDPNGTTAITYNDLGIEASTRTVGVNGVVTDTTTTLWASVTDRRALDLRGDIVPTAPVIIKRHVNMITGTESIDTYGLFTLPVKSVTANVITENSFDSFGAWTGAREFVNTGTAEAPVKGRLLRTLTREALDARDADLLGPGNYVFTRIVDARTGKQQTVVFDNAKFGRRHAVIETASGSRSVNVLHYDDQVLNGRVAVHSTMTMTRGRDVRTYRSPKLSHAADMNARTLSEFLAKNHLIIWKDGTFEFATLDAINRNSAFIMQNRKEILSQDVYGRAVARVVPLYKGGWQAVGPEFYRTHPLIVFRDGTARFASLAQIRADAAKLFRSGTVRTIERQRVTRDRYGDDVAVTVGRIYLGARAGLCEYTDIVNAHQEDVYNLETNRKVATVYLAADQNIGQEKVRIFRRVSAETRGLERTFGILLAGSTELGRSHAGDEYVQFYPTVMQNGIAVAGKAIVGLGQGNRNIYNFSVTRDRNNILTYNIDWSRVTGVATASSNLNIPEKDKVALGLAGRDIRIAAELDAQGVLQRAFIIDSFTDQEIGVINPVRYGNDGRQYYQAEIYTDKDRHVTYLLGSNMTAGGQIELFFRKLVSTASNEAVVGVSDLQGLVGVLSGKLRASVDAIAAEIGIAPADIRLVRSVSTNEGNGQNVFYRIQGDPLARIIVFQKNPSSAWFMVNTLFDGAKAKESYELTSLGEINYIRTTGENISRAALEQRIGLVDIDDLNKHDDGLSYRHFDEFIEVSSYRLPKGLADESSKDLNLVRYIAAGDPVAFDLVKVQQGNVSLMKYDDCTNLDERPFTVVSGEVTVLPSEKVVIRVTEWVGHNKPGQIYSYRPVYERNRGGTYIDPDITIDYNYITGVVAERFLDKDYVYYSLNSVPLMNRSTTVSLWQKIGNWLTGRKAAVEKNQSTFEVRVMQKDGVTYRLVREVNIPGASRKENLRSTLFVNDTPVAVRNGKDISLSTFFDSKMDVMRNGLPGVVGRSLGIGTYQVALPGQEGVTVDARSIMEEMEHADAVNVDVAKLDLESVNQLIDKDHPRVPGYRNWIKDRLLKPFNFVYGAIAMFLLSLLSLFKFGKRKSNMNVAKLAQLRSLEKKGLLGGEPPLPKGMADKWNVFMAANNAIVVKAYKDDPDRKVAAAKLENMLKASGGFFKDNEIKALVDLFRAGRIEFNDGNQDVQEDIAPLPGTFDISWVTGTNRGYENARPLAALRYALEHNWMTAEELGALMADVRKNAQWAKDVGNQWVQLFAVARVRLFEQAVSSTDPEALERTFPDPEVNMYKTLLGKGYTDLQAYVQDAGNGANVKQRVESYTREKILAPMIEQVRTGIPGLGDSMLDIRKAPLENAIVSEFYRFAMIDPSILPAADERVEGTMDFKPAVFDREFNPNVVLKYSEPATFREKVVYQLLMMPPSETQEFSLGAVGAIAPMTVYMTRFLIRKLQAVEQDGPRDPEGQRAAKEDVLREFGDHLRFWKAAFATSNWGGLFGKPAPLPGLFKRITEPGGANPNAQPKLYLKELFHDEYMYYFFERLQEQEDLSGDRTVYEKLMQGIMDNDVVLKKQLETAQGYLGDGRLLHKEASDERDPQKKAVYLTKVAQWKSDVDALLEKGTGSWTGADRSRAMALSAEALFWELKTIPPNVAGNEKLERFVHGPFTQLMGPVTKKTEQYRLERNSYAYFVNELTSTWKGDRHMWLFRRIIPGIALGWANAWLARKLGHMRFKDREFNETMTASKLAERIGEARGMKFPGGDPVKALNGLLSRRDLYQEPWVPSDLPGVKEIAEKLADKSLSSLQVERLNRRLIEASYPLETPRSVEFIGEDGKPTYSLKNSLEHYFGIKNKFIRTGIMAARAVLTVGALWLAATTSVGLGVIAVSAAWFLLPLIFGKVKVASEKPFWMSVWAIATGSIALCAELLFWKFAAVSFMSFGTFVTGGLLALLVPVTIMTAYNVAAFVKSFRTYQDRVWSKYWLARTVGWQSWLLFRPIQNWTRSGYNFSGEFYGKVLADIIDVQRQRGAILPANRLVQDKLIDDFNKAAKHMLLSPAELRALVASVRFIAYYHEGIKAGDAEWDGLVAAAREYEQALKDLGKKDLLKLSDKDLVSKKRPFVMVSPRELKAREFMYTNFQTIVLKKPVEDVFARMQGVSTHEQTYNEVATFPLENYGRLGTGNIAGSREFFITFKAEVERHLKDNIISKLENLRAKIDGNAMTIVAYLESVKNDITDDERDFLIGQILQLQTAPLDMGKFDEEREGKSGWDLLQASFKDKLKDQDIRDLFFKGEDRTEFTVQVFLEKLAKILDLKLDGADIKRKDFILKCIGSCYLFDPEGLKLSDFNSPLWKRFKEYLDKKAGKNLGEFVSAYNISAYPFTIEAIINKLPRDMDKRSQQWIADKLKEAMTPDQKGRRQIAETSLFGYALRKNPEMRENMLESLLARDLEQYKDFVLVFRNLEETDDVADAFYTWAQGKSPSVIKEAEEALAAFLNEFLPNSISVVTDIADDVFHMHLAAANAYGDLEYYNQALAMYRQYGSLAFASERTDDVSFREKFKFYQRSAKLKTTGMLQYGVIWGSNKEFRLVQKYERQEDFDLKEINISEYEYVSKAFESFLSTNGMYYRFSDRDLLSDLVNRLAGAGVGPLEGENDLEKMNKLLGSKDLYRSFEGVLLSKDIMDMIGLHRQAPLQGDGLVRLNRLILEEVYPKECPLISADQKEVFDRDMETLLRLKKEFRRIVSVQPGIKVIKTIDKKREVAFVKDMRDFSRAFLKFREENYLEILSLSKDNPGNALLSDIYELMQYIEESARSEALIPFYDKRTDDLIPANKNGGINLNAWMNYGRSWNMDAAVRGYLGQSLYRQTYAAYVGRNPEIVVVNPAFRIWTSTNDSYPGVQRYKIAQETFTQDSQRARAYLTTFYGKGGILQPTGNAMFTTPGEDSANFIIAMAQNPDLVSTHEDWMVWEWGRPSLHKESIAGTEMRYTQNVTRFEMDTGLFEIYLNPRVGYDVKKTNDAMFNHYLYATLASLLLVLLPGFQGFSGFAYLAPAIMFVPLTFLAMQSINFMNFLRHWRQEGSVLMMLGTGAKDIIQAFSYYVSMIPSFTKARLAADNETFRFIPTMKTMIMGILDRESRFTQQGRLEWAAHGGDGLTKGLKKTGIGGVAAGTVLTILAGIGKLLPGLSSIGPWGAVAGAWASNLLWAGPWIAVIGAVALLLGHVFDYRQKTDKGKSVAPIPIPFDNVIGTLGIISWLAGAVFTTTMGPIVTILYLLASIAPLTGGNVYDVFTQQVKDEKGNAKLRISGENQWAMFTDKPAMIKSFLGALAALVVFSFCPLPFAYGAAVRIAVNAALYLVMGASVWRGAFSNVGQAIRFMMKDIGRYRQDVRQEKVKREAFRAEQAPKLLEAPVDKTKDAAEAVAFQNTLAMERERTHQLYLRWKALLTKQKYLQDKASSAVKAPDRNGVDKAQAPDKLGGISLSDEHLAITVRVDDDGMPLPAKFQDPVMINIQGLVPVIRDVSPVTPANMPVMAELLK